MIFFLKNYLYFHIYYSYHIICLLNNVSGVCLLYFILIPKIVSHACVFFNKIYYLINFKSIYDCCKE